MLLGKETVCPAASDSVRNPLTEADPIAGRVVLTKVELNAPGPKLIAFDPRVVVNWPDAAMDPSTVPSIDTVNGFCEVRPETLMLKSSTRPKQPELAEVARIAADGTLVTPAEQEIEAAVTVAVSAVMLTVGPVEENPEPAT